MSNPFTLFEVSWEVCNKVGGIHTVISTKARTMVERLGDEYVAIGPWLLCETGDDSPFEEDPSFKPFSEACRQMGVPVRVGRWRIPGSPRTILIEFSSLYEKKDDILSRLWEGYGVDSLSGTWDYIEPVLFGHAAGMVIEKWWEEFVAPNHRRAVAHAHEWMTGAALLHLRKTVPSIGTVFTTHATMLGRALSSLGHSPDDGLGGSTPEELAETHGVVAKHSLEGICARESDAFTTVSEITAKEAELLHGRAASPLLPNGIDLSVIDEIAGATARDEARTTLQYTASKFLGEDVSDAAFLCISGRYEFHNKGIDLLLDSLVQMNENPGRRVVLFILVPAGNSGMRSDFLERMENGDGESTGPLGLSTHNLFDTETDPVHEHCARLGFENSLDSRVKVIQIPTYLTANDGFLNLPYEAVLRAMDLSCFPSYYEPWGYTPLESLAVGVPTITTDYAGFGRWANSQGFGAEQGVTVLQRVHVEYSSAVTDLANVLETFLREGASAKEMEPICRETAAKTSWSDLANHYDEAYQNALAGVQSRLERGVPQSRRPKTPVSVQPAPEGQRPRLFGFDVSATLPTELQGLQRLSRNYFWCWDPEGPTLFRELSPISWQASGHNPVAFLQRVYREDLDAKAADPDYLAMLTRVLDRFDAYMAEDTRDGVWFTQADDLAKGISTEHPVAYFCAEFGIHESLKIYSGGLGVLAGDHLKSASDLNLPFVAVGLFYREGYMTQRLGPNGEQVAEDVETDPRTLPLEAILGDDGNPLEISLPLPGRKLYLRAWKLHVGRVKLYLLDSNTASNRPEDRDITKNLYGGGSETRLQQEIVLGRGGVRLLRELDIRPAVHHMNEGHAAFLTLERVGQLARKEGLTFDEAKEFVRASTLFTTHTPVPAGHDRFDEDLMRRYFSDVPDWVGVPWERFYAMGQAGGEDEPDASFNMTYLALTFSSYCNGVSKLHGVASRSLLRSYWPSLLEEEVPVDSVTNGIHLPTWTHPKISRALGVDDRPVQGADFGKDLYPDALRRVWRAKQELKTQLIDEARQNLERGFLSRGDSPLLLTRSLDGLTDDALLIGFARRFAPYKRAHLIFQDPERLRRILGDEGRPVRLLVAGKAHPMDQHGKDILSNIVAISRDDDFAGRVFFLEDYDIHLARRLVQGVDVWLNNPTRMLEASGTSGMKASANGGLNLSIGDGWWPEAYNEKNGWLIGGERIYENQELQDQFDGNVLYRLLEEDVVPKYFERDDDGIPTAWLELVKENLQTIPTMFNTDRMVTDYLDKAYRGLGENYVSLSQHRKEEVKRIVQDKRRVRRGFRSIKIVSAQVADLSSIKVGEPLDAQVEVDLGSLSPTDVTVELVLGHSREKGQMHNVHTVELPLVRATDGSRHLFEGTHPMERSGTYSYGIRVRVADGNGPSDLALWA